MPDGSELFDRRHRDQRSMTDADQAEIAAIRAGGAIVDEGIYDDLVAGAMDDFEDETVVAREEWHQRDLAVDNGAGTVQALVEHRSRLLGEDYPFRIDDNRLVHSGRGFGWYEFMLAASVQRDLSSEPYNRFPQVFERASSVLSRGLLGPGASSLHVGTPRDAGRSFKEAFAELDRLTGEWSWRPMDGLPEAGPKTGDDGLDFVTWLAAGGDRPGHLFLLGQCACGDNWVSKLAELNLGKIGSWTGQAWAVEPIRLFATAHVLADGHFVRSQKDAGLILDRVRLCMLERSHGLGTIDEFRAEMAKLTNLVIDS
ncbi:MAG TPA: hypothetical protein VGG29_17775 [Caulobacteraceae bacterium]|jgi:hypothetical protein